MLYCDESKPYVFISYSHKDGEKVRQIIDRLCAEGYNVWYDEGIDPGTEWDENIAYHVQNCGYFIAFISKGYVNSKNCKDELNYSRDLDKEQLLVYLENVEIPAGMAMRLNRIQAIWWHKYDNVEEAYQKLFRASGIEKTKVGIAKVPPVYPTQVPPAMQVQPVMQAQPIMQTPSVKQTQPIKEKVATTTPKWLVPVIAAGSALVVAIIVVVIILAGNSSDKTFDQPDVLEDVLDSLASDSTSQNQVEAVPEKKPLTIEECANKVYDPDGNVIFGFNDIKDAGRPFFGEPSEASGLWKANNGLINVFLRRNDSFWATGFDKGIQEETYDESTKAVAINVSQLECPFGEAKLFKYGFTSDIMVSFQFLIIVRIDSVNTLEISLVDGGIANYSGTYLTEMSETVTTDNLEEILKRYEDPKEEERLTSYFAEMFE